MQRALKPAADMKSLLVSVDTITKVDDLTVHFKTKGPNALLVNNLTNLMVMNKAWSEANNAADPQNLREAVQNGATMQAMGTGPYQLVSRQPDVQTTMKPFDGYWDKANVKNGFTEIVYRPIKENATRIAALLSGEVDFVQDLPPQDIQRLQTTDGITVNSGPENRSIFFGMNVGIPELRGSDVKGKNPFADNRVRQAVNTAINREAIPARDHARPVDSAGHHRDAVHQRLHQGDRRLAEARCRRRPQAARRCRLPQRLLDHAALHQRSLR